MGESGLPGAERPDEDDEDERERARLRSPLRLVRPSILRVEEFEREPLVDVGASGKTVCGGSRRGG